MIELICPKCSRHMDALEAFSGLSLLCPDCLSPLDIPAPGPHPDDVATLPMPMMGMTPAPRPAPPPSPVPPPHPPRRRPSRWVAPAALGLTLTLLGGLGGAWWASRPSGQAPHPVAPAVAPRGNGEARAASGTGRPAGGVAVPGPCGAITRDGTPCRRVVRGGGYCWQHRDR
jgi:hypothetical protein